MARMPARATLRCSPTERARGLRLLHFFKRKAQLGQGPVRLPLRLFPAPAQVARAEADVFGHRLREEVELGVLHYQAAGCAQAVPTLRRFQSLAVQLDGTAPRRQDALEYPQQGGLAAAGGTQHAQHLAPA